MSIKHTTDTGQRCRNCKCFQFVLCNINTDRARLKSDMYVHIYLNHTLRNNAEDSFRNTLAAILEKKNTDENSLTQEEKDFFEKYTTTDSHGNIVVSNTDKFEYMLCKGIRI